MNKTDKQQTLWVLKKVGDKGIHSFELNRLIGSTRAAARINDLKHEGYQIDTKHEKVGNAWGVRYFLRKSVKEEIKPFKWEFDLINNIARKVLL